MTKLSFNTRIRGYTLVALLTALIALTGCGGEEDDSPDSGQSDSERIAALEERMDTFQGYIVAQAKKEREANGEAVNGLASAPRYKLAKENASENEREIVLWMADCSARTYLNPNLPKEVLDREIVETERRMWDALEAGQHSSFEAFIGMAFRFCQARIVEENRE